MNKRFVPYKKWLHQHDEDIKSKYEEHPTEDIAKEISVNYYTVSRRAKRLGVGKSETFMHTSWKKGGGKIGSKRTKSTEESDIYMRKHFADTPNDMLAEHFGVDVKTVRRWARKLGLVKSGDFMHKSRSRGRFGKNFYTPEQIAWRNQRIAEVYPDADEEDLQRLADELGVVVDSIYRLAYHIGVRRRKHPPQFIADLAEYFPTHTDKECAERFGIKKIQVQNIARKYGWKKTRSHMRSVYDSNVKAALNGKRKRSAC